MGRDHFLRSVPSRPVRSESRPVPWKIVHSDIQVFNGQIICILDIKVYQIENLISIMISYNLTFIWLIWGNLLLNFFEDFENFIKLQSHWGKFSSKPLESGPAGVTFKSRLAGVPSRAHLYCQNPNTEIDFHSFISLHYMYS